MKIKLKKLLVVLMAAILVMSMLSVAFAAEDKTEELKIKKHSTEDGKTTLTVTAKVGDEDKDIDINPEDYEIGTDVYKYEDKVLLKVTYTEDGTVKDVKVVNSEDKKEIDKPTNENLEKLFKADEEENKEDVGAIKATTNTASNTIGATISTNTTKATNTTSNTVKADTTTSDADKLPKAGADMMVIGLIGFFGSVVLAIVWRVQDLKKGIN